MWYLSISKPQGRISEAFSNLAPRFGCMQRQACYQSVCVRATTTCPRDSFGCPDLVQLTKTLVCDKDSKIFDLADFLSSQSNSLFSSSQIRVSSSSTIFGCLEDTFSILHHRSLSTNHKRIKTCLGSSQVHAAIWRVRLRSFYG